MTARPMGTARRMTARVERYQNNCSTGLGVGSGLRNTRRNSRRTSSASSRSPRSQMAAGVTITAAAAVNATVATPA